MEYFTSKKLEKLIDYKKESINTEILLNNNDSKAILFAIEKEQLISKHTTPVDALLYVIEGKVQFQTPNNTYDIEKGELFKIKANIEHSVLGLKDSKILVIRI